MRRLVSAGFSLALLIGVAWAVLNYQMVIDWWRLRSYTPSAGISQLADEDTMTAHGRELFYVSDPKVEDSADFNQACHNQGEQSIVLGCYTGQRIFVYNVTDPRLDGVKEVTAAHEMLHAAYDRLSPADKQRVNDMLKPIIDTMADQRILDLIRLYNQQEPGELYNEMHSILGTEYAGLTPQLEDYYKQYFSDRQKVVSYSQQYQAVFTASKNSLAAYDTQLDTLKTQIDQNNASLHQQQMRLEAASAELSSLRTRGDIAGYNQQVPAYNATVRDFNALVDQTRSLVAQYNAIVGQRNHQATAQNNLYQSLDSNYQAAPQQ